MFKCLGQLLLYHDDALLSAATGHFCLEDPPDQLFVFGLVHRQVVVRPALPRNTEPKRRPPASDQVDHLSRKAAVDDGSAR